MHECGEDGERTDSFLAFFAEPALLSDARFLGAIVSVISISLVERKEEGAQKFRFVILSQSRYCTFSLRRKAVGAREQERA